MIEQRTQYGGDSLRRLTFGENLTVFVLFFGMLLVDALASRVWWRAAFWFAIALIFRCWPRNMAPT